MNNRNNRPNIRHEIPRTVQKYRKSIYQNFKIIFVQKFQIFFNDLKILIRNFIDFEIEKKNFEIPNIVISQILVRYFENEIYFFDLPKLLTFKICRLIKK